MMDVFEILIIAAAGSAAFANRIASAGTPRRQSRLACVLHLGGGGGGGQLLIFQALNGNPGYLCTTAKG